jgi:hypothetical protein
MSKYKVYPGVKGKVQCFSEELLKKFDEPARKKVKEVLGSFVIDNPNPYGQDLIIKSDKCKYKYLELQVCNQWVNEPYPYDKVYIYARKIRYNSNTLFLTLSRDLKWGYLFDTIELKKNNVQPRRFKKYSREFVYDIPWHRLTKVYMNTIDVLTFELL